METTYAKPTPVDRLEALTDEMKAAIPGWVVKSVDEALRPGPLTEEEWLIVEDGLRESRKFAGYDGPIIRVASPLAAIRQGGWGYRGGHLWYSWPATVAYYREVCGLQLAPDIAARADAEMKASLAGWALHLEDRCIVSDRHVEIHRDRNGRLHNTTGPAMRWRPDPEGIKHGGDGQGFRIYVINGTMVPWRAVEEPGWLTAEKVRDERNAERRRAFLTIYGEDRFVDDVGAELVHEDAYGKLYRLPGHGLKVRVEDSTTLPDGTRRVYWLGVHPELRPLGRPATMPSNDHPVPMTAHAAVASTFGLTPEEYSPKVET